MSGEEAMEIPPSRLSIEPEAPALLILQSPVVARGTGLPAPPFGRDAGRALGAPHAMTAPLPEEFLRRVARRLHALRPCPQAQGAGADGPARGRMGRRRQGTEALQRPLRQMALLGNRARQAIEAQAIAQPIDEGRQFRRTRLLAAPERQLQI